MTGPHLLRLGALTLAAVSLIVVGDTAGKVLTAGSVPPAFAAWSRFAMAALVLLPFSGLKPHELRGFLDPLVILRGVLVSGGIFSILTALKTAPIADVYGAFFIGPVVSFVLAALFLKEPVTWVRTLLLLTGFAGVLLVVKPGFGSGAGIWFGVQAGLFYGAFLATTRAVAARYRPRFLLISQLLTGAVVLAPFGLSAPLPADLTSHWGPLVISALGSAAGNYLLVEANRRAGASVIAPLIYTQLMAATLAGIVVFGAWPDSVAFIGLMIILASGLGSLLLVRGASS